MDNKLSELSKPEQFDAEVEIHGGEPFAVRAPAINGSHVKAEQYFALLAELEASKQYAKERDAENESLALTVGRLRVELHNEGAANAHAYERIRGLEKRLATPVRLGAGVLMVSAYSANSCDSEWHFCLARDSVVSAIRAAGFTVEGDE